MELHYYKLEQRDNFDMKATRTVYKLKRDRRFSGKDFVRMVAHRYGFSETIIEGVLSDVADELALLLGEGAAVTVPGIGSFSLGIRLKEERREHLDDEQEPNSANLELHHVNFRLDKELFHDVGSRFARQTLTRVYGRRGKRITIDDSLQSDRLAAAHAFLRKNTFMHVADYASITGLSLTSAQRELQDMVKLKHAGIISRGRGTHRVWMLSESALGTDDE